MFGLKPVFPFKPTSNLNWV